jgi:hypothetical protein
MKLLSLLTGLLLCGSARAIQYTDIYDIFQGGYDNGGFVTGTIKITEADGIPGISQNDVISGVVRISTDVGNGRTNVTGFDVHGINGPSLLSGSFSIIGVHNLGGLATITNTGGVVDNLNFPFNGQFTTTSTTQPPVVTRRIPDEGSSLALLCLGLVSLRRLKFRR